MDAEEDGVISLDEFYAWGIGESRVAAERNPTEELDAAKRTFYEEALGWKWQADEARIFCAAFSGRRHRGCQ
ncbi:hypothetical protein [Fulvimarina sp. MAC8]|uniref:hypothetical protein n=1 Tax=Fulvimarina sp. MAC8 TaxID=3162874 RepID=UPI0032EB3EDE